MTSSSVEASTSIDSYELGGATVEAGAVKALSGQETRNVVLAVSFSAPEGR